MESNLALSIEIKTVYIVSPGFSTSSNYLAFLLPDMGNDLHAGSFI